ncbi:MAG: hypothetical protein KJZ87_14920 [Thermoguttaceae bacterium]|nr:hypothetical protein [Thermoguttaceae bacterium]
MKHALFAMLLSAVLGTVGLASAPPLKFVPDEQGGGYTFDTGVLRGHVRMDGRSQGIDELVHTGSGVAVAEGGHLPGIFSHYRVFSTATRYGDAARDWPTETRLLPDGALEVHWPAAEEHPLEMAATFRWAAPDTLDLTTTVKPQRAMPDFEIFLSSYFRPDFRALVYVKPNYFSQGQPELLPADVNPLVDGSYLIFPRDRQAVQTIFDGRWEKPPHPVQWSVTRWFAAPLALRRHDSSGVAAAIMSLPSECFAVSVPYNKSPPDGVAGHQSIYLSLFGQDLAAGQSATARARLVVGEMTDEDAIRACADYIQRSSGDAR